MEKNVFMFKNLRSCKPEAVGFDEVVSMIGGGQLKAATDGYRNVLAELDAASQGGDAARVKVLKASLSRLKSQMPAFVGWVTLRGGRSEANVTGYTGCVMVDLDHLSAAQFPAALAAVRADRHTLLAYTTVSGQGIRVVCRMGGTVGKDNFRHAWDTANRYYARLCGCPFDHQCSNPTRMSVVCHDPDVLFRPDAEPMEIIVPKPTCTKGKGRQLGVAAVGAIARKALDREGLRYEAGHRNEYVSRMVYMLNRYGVVEDDALAWLTQEFADYNASNGNPLPAMVHSVYSNHRDEHGTLKPELKSVPRSDPKAMLAAMEQFISTNYLLRLNVVSGAVEWARKGKDGMPIGVFEEMDDTFENSLWCELQRNGIALPLLSLVTLLRSNFVKPFHPMMDYLDSLPEWDCKTDYIGELLSLVHCVNVPHETFDMYVRRWLVAMVAAAVRDDVVNHEILVLLGRQGTFKSSFMSNILPPCLRSYYSVKTNSHRMDKDDAFALAENFLINFEEIDSMQRNELNQLKALTTVAYIKDRPAYGRRKVRLPHRASFCATGNNLQFLTDNTGNRRWLVFEVDHIDNPWTANINYDGVYAQAKALIESGYRYWFDSDEIVDINRLNREFETPDTAREMVVTHFRRPKPYEKCLYLTSTQIAARFAPQLKVSPVAVGRVLRELEYEQMRSKDGRFWKVVEYQCSDIGSFIPETPQEDNVLPF